ncbi:MAG TPA: CHAP domain-containing protein, partial [Acidimicrobiales bacterium]|nr:CHAP domain-containing protein [Acidimicrobiales bacterium]
TLFATTTVPLPPLALAANAAVMSRTIKAVGSGSLRGVATATAARVASRAAETKAGSPNRRPTTGLFKDGGVLAYGAAQFFGSPTGVRLAAPIVAMAATPDGGGYWLAGADGGVLAYGDAKYFGGTASRKLYAPIVAMAPTPDGGGYWLVSLDGGVFAFGDAKYYGSTGETHLPEPIVGFAPTPDGKGYWLAGSHGEVYAFGDAGYYGSLGTTNLHNIPIVAIASSFDGRGYWLVQGGGEVIPYGDAPRIGEMPPGHPPVNGIAVTADGRGYWLVCGNGEVDAFGDAAYLGGNNATVPRPPITRIVADPTGTGYWLLDSASFEVGFEHPDAMKPAVNVAASQLGPSKGGGNYCSPYGPCEEWCALFATWVWEKAGVPVPRYAFVGDVYRWVARYAGVIPVNAPPVPGDLVFYGTGPQTVGTSPHMGIVAQVWPDGAIDTVEGDSGPGPGGWTSVLVNGPYLVSQSFFANGMPIYAFGVPERIPHPVAQRSRHKAR